MLNTITQIIYPGNNNNNNNPSKKGLGGIWSWNNNGNWVDFDNEASKQIDEQIRHQWQNNNSNMISFPITKGQWFSQKKNLGVYFCNVQLNHSKSKIKQVMQQNIKTGFGRNMKRIPPFQLHPHSNNKNSSKHSKHSNKNHSTHNNKHNSHSNKNNNNNSNNFSGHNSNSKNNSHSHKNNSKNKNNSNNNNNNYNNNNNFSTHNNSNNNNISMHGNNNNANKYNFTPSNPNQYYGYTQTNMSNMPNMSAGPQQNNDGSVCWSWKDDFQWKSYDDPTISQIENAYNNGGQSVVLNSGPYFGQRQGQYIIQFNRQSIPHQFMQVNTNTRFTRNVGRTGGNNNNNNNNNNSESNNNDNNNNSNNINDKHGKWRQYYKPMRISHFNKLKDKDKLCNICFCEFEEKELFENECQEFKKQIESQSQKSEINDENINKEKKEEKDNDGDTEIKDNDSNNESNESNDNKKANESSYDISRDLLNKITDNTIIYLSKCVNTDHYFHSECISRWLNEKGKCSHCQKRYAIETGTQPLNGRLKYTFLSYSCKGYEKYGTIKINFEFDSGIQGKEHYHPGQPYYGDHREVYFPNNEAGREALELTKIAFERRLIFTIGASLTTKKENRIVWGSIHFKSRMEGGQQRHGYPDQTYFDRFKEELKAKGVTTDDIKQNGLNNIKNGYNNHNPYGNMYSQY